MQIYCSVLVYLMHWKSAYFYYETNVSWLIVFIGKTQSFQSLELSFEVYNWSDSKLNIIVDKKIAFTF